MNMYEVPARVHVPVHKHKHKYHGEHEHENHVENQKPEKSLVRHRYLFRQSDKLVRQQHSVIMVSPVVSDPLVPIPAPG
jgi:hypothetical protein